MKLRFGLFKGKSGNYFCQDRETGRQESLKTNDKAEAERLLTAKNEAHQNLASINLHIARAYFASADPGLNKRTWRYTFEELIKTKNGENASRWERAMKDRAFKRILDLVLNETRAEHFLGGAANRQRPGDIYWRHHIQGQSFE